MRRRRVVAGTDSVSVRPSWGWLVAYGGLPSLIAAEFFVVAMLSTRGLATGSRSAAILLTGSSVVCVVWRLLRAGLDVSTSEVIVRNVWRTQRLGWSAIERWETVDLRPWFQLSGPRQHVGGLGVRLRSGHLVRCVGAGSLSGPEVFEILDVVRKHSAAAGVGLITPTTSTSD